MPKSEKQKAPESKAMPRQKAPRLSVEADTALKKLEEATERKEGAVWLDPKRYGIPHPSWILWSGTHAVFVNENVLRAARSCP